jgi:hypothetical protein
MLAKLAIFVSGTAAAKIANQQGLSAESNTKVANVAVIAVVNCSVLSHLQRLMVVKMRG